jgi:hypothetical protein
MKSRQSVNLLRVALLLFLSWSCDTPDNVSLPNYFIKYFGVDGEQTGVDIVVNADGTILLLGTTNSARNGLSNKDLFLVKSDAKGNLIWKNSFGSKSSEDAKDIEVTTDGRIVLLGTSEKNGDKDVMVIITDQSGVKLDSVVYGYPGSDEVPNSISQTSDGFIVTGSTTNVGQKANPVTNDAQDAFNFRFYNDLTSYPNTWNETMGPGTIDVGVKVIQVGTGFYFFGYSNKQTADPSKLGLNFWVFPLNNFGNGSFIVGEEILVGGIADERLSSVTLSPPESGEGFLLTGTATNSSGSAVSNNIYIVKLRKSLNFAGTSAQALQRDPISLGNDLGIISDFSTKSNASILSGFLIVSNDKSLGNENIYLTKVDNNCNNEWDSPQGFNFGGSYKDTIGGVAELPDGSILMVGTFSVGDDQQQKMALIKVNKDGKFQN